MNLYVAQLLDRVFGVQILLDIERHWGENQAGVQHVRTAACRMGFGRRCAQSELSINGQVSQLMICKSVSRDLLTPFQTSYIDICAAGKQLRSQKPRAIHIRTFAAPGRLPSSAEVVRQLPDSPPTSTFSAVTVSLPC